MPDKTAIISKVRAAGIVGCGGAGFPTHIKLQGECDTVIANGAECEPLLHCDQELMRLHPQDIINGMQYAMQAVGAKHGVIALKKKYDRAIAALQPLLPANMRLFLLGSYYPSGDEHVLVYEVTGRVVPEGGIPLDVGVLVQNVGTLAQIAHAVEDDLGVTNRLVTLAGDLNRPGTYRLPIGLAVSKAIEIAGGSTVEKFAVVEGGPMMGLDVDPHNAVIKKTTTGLIVLANDHPYIEMRQIDWQSRLKQASVSCEQCRFCTDFCPRYLLGHRLYPDQIMKAVGWNTVLKEEHILGAQLCIECGLCGIYWACPNKLSPDHYNTRLKQDFRANGVQTKLFNENPVPHEMRDGRHVPVEKLTQRLSLTEYVGFGDMVGEYPDAEEVRIPLDAHIGKAAKARVRIGQAVACGEMIASVSEDQLGANVHASISGKVVAIDDRFIVIQK